MQGASRTSGAIWGSVSCSRTFQHAAQLGPAQELVFKPATFRSLADLLYPLSHSRPIFAFPPDVFINVFSCSVFLFNLFHHAHKGAAMQSVA